MADFEDFEKKEGYTYGGSYSEKSNSSYKGDQDGSTYRSSYEGGSRSYSNRSGGYSRDGYGSGYRSGGYRSRYGRNDDGEQTGNQESRSYNDRSSNYSRGGSYGDRPYRSNYRRDGERRPRFNNSNNEGGYRPRYNNDSNYEGGYRPRYEHDGRQGGYRSRYGNAGGEGSYRQGGYSRGGYRGGNNNRQGSYRQGGFGNRYNPKRRTAFAENIADPDAPIRLNKYLANAGVCSRRDADKYIEAGVVTVNGVVVTELGTKVKRTDEVHFHDQLIKPELKIYVLLNKPKGYVTTSDDPNNRKTVMDLVKGACPERIYPVGRLDRNTTGVLLLTNDGEMASKLTHPKFLKKKIYHVWLDKNLRTEDAQRIAEGITLDDGDIKADDIQYVNAADRKQVGIEIHSGRNRIVRRMFEALGYHVIKLDRVFFAGLTKKNLKRGAWRFLTEEEVNFLRMGSFE